MAPHDPDLESEFARRRRVNRWALNGAITSAVITGMRLGLLVSGLIPAPLAVALTSIAFIAAGLVVLDRLAAAGPRTIIASAAFALPPLGLGAFWLLFAMLASPVPGVVCYMLFEAAMIGIAAAAIAIANARPDTRTRPLACMKCGYPLDSVATNRCPECGAMRRGTQSSPSRPGA